MFCVGFIGIVMCFWGFIRIIEWFVWVLLGLLCVFVGFYWDCYVFLLGFIGIIVGFTTILILFITINYYVY